MFKSLTLTIATILLSIPVLAQEGGTSQAPLPRSIATPVRIAPVFGGSSFTTRQNLDDVNFNQGFSAGVLADFGPGFWSFETGILSLNSSETRVGNTTSVTMQTWAVPLLAKFNTSGHPHQTLFVKAGVMPFSASGASSTSFDLMAVGGLGGHIPLGRSSSLLLDASYDRMITKGGQISDFQGISLLAGLSLNI